MIMEAAVRNGDARKLAELIKKDPGFNVNSQDGSGCTLLYVACRHGKDAVIPLLLAHPDIDVNLKDKYDQTPCYCACSNGRTSCVRLLLNDLRVMVNEPAKN